MRELWKIFKQTVRNWLDDRAYQLSAALAYYTVFALAPLLVIAVVIASLILRQEEAQEQTVQAITTWVGGLTEEQARTMLQTTLQAGSGLLATIISGVILLYAASYVFAILHDSMNTIWNVRLRDDVGWWYTIRKRLLAVVLVFTVAILLLASVFVTATLTAFADRITAFLFGLQPDDERGWLGIIIAYGIDITVSVGIVTLLFAAIFKFLPDAKIQWRHVWLGALITAVLFVIGKYGLSLYFAYSSPASAFGAAGSLAAFLIWIYYSTQIFFFGAEFIEVYTRRKGARIVPDRDAIPLEQEARVMHGLRPRETAIPSPRKAIPKAVRPIPRPFRSTLLFAGGLLTGMAVGIVGLFTRRSLLMDDDEVGARLRELDRAARRTAKETRLPRAYNRVNAGLREVEKQLRAQ